MCRKLFLVLFCTSIMFFSIDLKAESWAKLIVNSDNTIDGLFGLRIYKIEKNQHTLNISNSINNRNINFASRYNNKADNLNELVEEINNGKKITYHDLAINNILIDDDLLVLKNVGVFNSPNDIVSFTRLLWIADNLGIRHNSVICPENYRPNQRDEKIPDFDDPCLTTSTIP